MKKSLWMEVVEWIVLCAVALFTFGVLVLRNEITASPDQGSSAPVVSLDE